MTDKELRRLNRAELLKLLIEQRKELDETQLLLKEANERLRDRSIAIESSGSIAEAALKINGFFEAAQAAAEQYIDNLGINKQPPVIGSDDDAE